MASFFSESSLVLPLLIVGGLTLLGLIYQPLLLERPLPRRIMWPTAVVAMMLITWSLGEMSGLNCQLGL